MKRTSEKGFTLLEVLVALAVLSVALLAVLRVVGQQALAVDVLTERTFANWVASNALTELKLTEPWPDPGRNTGRARMGNRDWYWEIRVSNTEVEQIRRIDTRVFVDPARQRRVTELAGFVGRP